MGKSFTKTTSKNFDWWGLLTRSSKYWIPVVIKLGEIAYNKIKELIKRKKEKKLLSNNN